MRQEKTSKRKRNTYIYYSADGRKVVELTPGEEGVTEAHIALLHESDDVEYNANRREAYHTPIYWQAYTDGEGAEDRNSFLADEDSHPEMQYMDYLIQKERSLAFQEIWDKLLPQQRALIQKKVQGRSNVEIAEEEGVSEAAIRNRLKKIQEKFKKLQ